MLKVICGLELSIEHRIFLHPHESSIRIRLGIAVPFATYPEFFFILLKLADIFIKSFYRTLKGMFPFSDAMNELYPFFFLQLIQFLFEIFHRLKCYLILIDDLYPVESFTFSTEGGDLFSQLDHVF